ncbi:hypothetical protein [Vibrio splendidus]|uniref:hypothetical protein n=1 Tax=Vibrio splendidus TaxID=29497 RepID=UPI002468DF1E|nr:hypothetical protein [Vibrio splendidus]MDH5931192.1 hypothetical protein [Vibrio splendidus]
MNKNQQGAVVLLTTSVLLVTALMLTFGSYRSVFYQIKRSQNEVEARKQQWEAEGGLECGFTYIVNQKLQSIPNNLATVCNSYSFSSLNADFTNPEILLSQVGHSSVNKTIIFSSSGGYGSMRSTSDVISFGSALFSPPDPGEFDSAADAYECIGAVVKYRFIATGITNHGVSSSIESPGSGHDPTKDCKPSHKTSTAAKSGIWENSFGVISSHNVGLDIQRDDTIDPFKDFFGVDKSKWQEVRDDVDNEFIKVAMPSSSVDCYSQFSDSIVNGQPNKVWIDGSCQLAPADVTNIVNLQAANPGTDLFLLVHDGVFGVTGSGDISGVFFHFNNTYSPTPSQWDSMTEVKPFVNTVFSDLINTMYGSSSTLTPYHATYAQAGAFSFTGGQFFDTEGQMALFNNSLNFSFNSDVIDEFGFSPKPRWQKGSWNDL